MLISTALLLDSNIRNSAVPPGGGGLRNRIKMLYVPRA
jgi:hypothetical protein